MARYLGNLMFSFRGWNGIYLVIVHQVFSIASICFKIAVLYKYHKLTAVDIKS